MAENKRELEGIRILDIDLDLKRSIYKTIKYLPKSYSLLIIVKTKRYEKLVNAILDMYVNDEKLPGLYISTSKPAIKLISAIEKDEKLKMDDVFFVDCMTEFNKQEGKIFYCPPQNLTDLNLGIEKMLSLHPEIGFILLDSLSTLFIYNEPRPIEKFVTTLVRKINDRKIKGIVITAKTTSNAAALEDLAVFFDEVLKLNL